MSANYWESSQRNSWTLEKWRLDESRKEDLKYVSEKQLQWLYFYYTDHIFRLGRKLGVRQQVIATAVVYFRRYYTRNSLRSTDPILVLATCMFLATKVEECPHHIKNVVEGMRGILPEGFAYESTHIAEFEFYLLEEMDFYMILYHPYRPLSQYLTDLGLDRTLLQAGWSTVNDTYRSTLPLLYPPHMIALAVIFILVPQADLASEASQPKEAAIVEWLKTIRVDKDEVMEIVNRIMELYRDLDDYEEPLVPELLRRLKA